MPQQDKFHKFHRVIAHFFEISPAFLCVADKDGKVLIGNKSWEEQFAKTTTIPTVMSEPIENSSGQKREIEWQCLPIEGFLFLIGRDATEERDNKRFLEAILDNLPLALFAKDASNEFRFIQWNKQAEKFFGLKRDQVLGKNDYDFFPEKEADHFRKKDEETLSHREVNSIEEEPVTGPSQETRWVRTHKIGICTHEDNNPNILLGLSEDVTELRKQVEKAKIQQAQLVATAKLSSLGEMAAGVAHEINYPLAIIKGKVSRMNDKMQGESMTTEEISNELVRIDATIDRIARIVKGLHTFGRRGDNDPFQKTHLRLIIEETLEISRARFRSNGVELRVDIPDNIWVMCRPVQIAQVISNLINNSFDSVNGEKNAWVEVKAEVHGKLLKLRVVDSGKGIVPEIQDKIFAPFFTTKGVGKGTGLGLSIARGIIEEHKGNLFYDKQSKHTAFVFELPLVNESTEEKVA